jgi:amino acid adenylation domain-containing protein
VALAGRVHLRERLVALYLPRGIELAIGALAALRQGGSFVALDPATHPVRMQQIWSDSQAAILVTDRAHASRAAELLEAMSRGRSIAPIVLVDDPSLAGPSPAASAVAALSPFYIVYTSGSAGTPKGIVVPHRSIPGFLGSTDRPLFKEGCRMLFHSSISWDVLVMELFGPLLRGGTSVVHSDRLTVQSLMEKVARHGIDTLWLSAAQLNTIADTHLDALSGIETLVAGGEALSVRHVLAVRRRFPSMRIINGYGPCETTVFATTFELPTEFERVPRSIPIGVGVGDRRVYVLDGSLNEVPPGLAGELCVGGDGVPWGYLHQPALTATRFVPDPFGVNQGNRLYCTGDIVRELPNGQLEYLQRNDHQVKIRGHRIEMEEIEASLRRHPGIAQAAAVIRKDRNGDSKIVAFVVPRAGASLEKGEVSSFARRELPDYMSPSIIRAVPDLPLNENAKICRSALPNPLLDEHSRDDECRAELRGHTEELLAELWRRALKLDRISPEDDLFRLGGHSLTAVMLGFEILQRTGVDVRRAIFQRPVLRDLAAFIDEARPMVPSGQLPEAPGDGCLSREQMRLWFLQASDPSSAAYNVPCRIDIEGVLDERRLEGCLRNIVGRHQALRTTVICDRGVPAARQGSGHDLELRVVDLPSFCGAMAGGDTVEALMTEEANRAFTPQDKLPLRALLIRSRRDRATLCLIFHHICVDGWSLDLFARELRDLWVERGSSLGEPAPAYEEYARRQRAYLASPSGEQAIEAMVRRLQSSPSSLALPRGSLPAGTSSKVEVRELPTRMTATLREYCQSVSTTPFTVTLTAFELALYAITGQLDISIGTPVSTRAAPDDAKTIGMFANTAVVRGTIDPDLSFQQMVRRNWTTLQDAIAHADVPFDVLIERLNPRRVPGANPLFEAMFSYSVAYGINFASDSTRFAWAPPSSVIRTGKFDLSFDVEQDAAGDMRIIVEVADGRYRDDVSVTLINEFVAILDAGLAEPSRQIKDLVSRPSDAMRLARVRGSRESVVGLFEHWAERTPAAVAVECAHAQLTYRDLNERANKLAHVVKAGQRPGQLPNVVVVALERSAELFVALLGILKAEAAYAIVDLSHPEERLRYMLADMRPHTAVACSRDRDRLRAYGLEVIAIDEWDRIETQPAGNLRHDIRPADVAYVAYTSGSSGRPKGVIVPHRGISRLVERNGYLAFTPNSRLLLLSPLTFDACVIELWGGITHGGRTVIMPGSPELLEQLRSTPDLCGANVIGLVAPLFNYLVDENPGAVKGRTFLVGGDVVSRRHVQVALDELGAARVIHLYGPTETTLFATSYEPVRFAVPEVLPIGKAIADTRAHVLDQRLLPTPPETLGEIYIGGGGVAWGYLGRPDLTAEAFVPDPLADEPGSRMYRTGDWGKTLGDGDILFGGRRDAQVKVRGIRIELAEIEAALCTLPDVKEAVATAVQEDGHNTVIGYFVARRGSQPTVAEIRNGLEKRLPAMMIPQHLVALEGMPLTENGKIDYRCLPTPRVAAVSGSHPDGQPRTEVEVTLAAIWRALLRAGEVRLDDDFFLLGGHSLLVVRLGGEIERRWGVRLALRQLLQHTSLRDLARLLTVELILEAKKHEDVTKYLSRLPAAEIEGVLGSVRQRLGRR